MSITVITTARNAEEYAARSVLSVASQTVKPRVHYFVDAESEDRTIVAAYRGLLCSRDWQPTSDAPERLKLVRSPRSVGKLENIVRIVRTLPPDEIVVLVDGDDWLAHDTVLEKVERIYNPGSMHLEPWMTFGQYMNWPSYTRGFARGLIPGMPFKLLRTGLWGMTHLKTFKAGLFQAIPIEYLLDSKGMYLAHADDLAFMWAMGEMAGNRAEFIPEILYIYNQAHMSTPEDGEYVRWVRGMTPLERLDTRPW